RRETTAPRSAMAEDVEHAAAGLANEEAAYSPGLVGELVDDLVAVRERRRVGRVDVVDLDRDVRAGTRGRVSGDDADLLAVTVGGRVRDGPPLVPDRLP